MFIRQRAAIQLIWEVTFMPGNFSKMFCPLLIFFKINFFKIFFQEYHQSVKQFGSRSVPTFWNSLKFHWNFSENFSGNFSEMLENYFTKIPLKFQFSVKFQCTFSVGNVYYIVYLRYCTVLVNCFPFRLTPHHIFMKMFVKLIKRNNPNIAFPSELSFLSAELEQILPRLDWGINEKYFKFE